MSKKLSKEYRVEVFLQVALEEFLSKGYDSTSVDAIAKKAGVSKGGFYHHFPNKETLLMEANRKLSEPIVELALKAVSHQSPMEGLRQYIKDYLLYWRSRPQELSFFFLSMSKALATPILLDYYKESVKETTAFFVGMFQRAIDLQEINIADPIAYGVSLMGALDGAVSYAIIHPEEGSEVLSSRFEQIWINNILVKKMEEQHGSKLLES